MPVNRASSDLLDRSAVAGIDPYNYGLSPCAPQRSRAEVAADVAHSNALEMLQRIRGGETTLPPLGRDITWCLYHTLRVFCHSGGGFRHHIEKAEADDEADDAQAKTKHGKTELADLLDQLEDLLLDPATMNGSKGDNRTKMRQFSLELYRRQKGDRLFV